MDSGLIATWRELGRANWLAVRTLVLLGALLALGPIPLSAAAGPLLATGEATATVVNIPGDYPLPEAGARIAVPVPAGGEIHFDLEAFDPASAQALLEGADLVLRLANGGELILEGFFASVDPPAAIVLGDGLAISAELLLAQLAALEWEGSTTEPLPSTDVDKVPIPPVPVTLAQAVDSPDPIETAAGGPTAAGGGEIFGLVQVVSWLVDRINIVSKSEAAEPLQLAQSGDLARFLQLEAQLLIAREAEIAKLAANYRDVTRTILAALKDRLAGGGGSRADVDQAEAIHLEAQLEVKEAEFRHALAIDAHQDAYGERLQTATLPVWQAEPPDDLAAITADLPPEQRAMARRYWRQARHASETLKLLETLVVVAEAVRDAYRQQFEVAQRTLLDVEYAEKTLFQARVRLVQRQVDLLTAEAWLLAAIGQLSPDHIKRPGWQ